MSGAVLSDNQKIIRPPAEMFGLKADLHHRAVMHDRRSTMHKQLREPVRSHVLLEECPGATCGNRTGNAAFVQRASSDGLIAAQPPDVASLRLT